MLFICLVFGWPFQAQAQSQNDAPVLPEDLKKTIVESQEAIEDFSDGLSEEAQRHFAIIYNTHNVIGVVEMVEDSLGKAVEACGAEHPGMKPDIDQEFKAWQQSVEDVKGEARANIENMIIAQDYASQDKIGTLLDQADAARIAGNNAIEKKPVTTRKACDNVMQKMSETKDRMIDLLRRTLVSFPRTLSKEPVVPSKAESE